VVLVLAPLFFDVAAALTDGSLLSWEPDSGTRIALIPRDGGPMRWCDDDAFWVWHIAGAYELDDPAAGNPIVVDYVQWERPGGLVAGLPPDHGRLARVIVERVEFPRIDDRQLTTHHRIIATAGVRHSNGRGDTTDTATRPARRGIRNRTARAARRRRGSGGRSGVQRFASALATCTRSGGAGKAGTGPARPGRAAEPRPSSSDACPLLSPADPVRAGGVSVSSTASSRVQATQDEVLAGDGVKPMPDHLARDDGKAGLLGALPCGRRPDRLVRMNLSAGQHPPRDSRPSPTHEHSAHPVGSPRASDGAATVRRARVRR
jgi:Retinal pigment epithelial membrane protein